MWHAKHRNFSYQVTLTREEKAGYLHGRVEVVLPTLFADLSKHSVFAAGSPGFVDACVATVKRLGASDHLIHSEGFHHQQGAGGEPAASSLRGG